MTDGWTSSGHPAPSRGEPTRGRAHRARRRGARRRRARRSTESFVRGDCTNRPTDRDRVVRGDFTDRSSRGASPSESLGRVASRRDRPTDRRTDGAARPSTTDSTRRDGLDARVVDRRHRRPRSTPRDRAGRAGRAVARSRAPTDRPTDRPTDHRVRTFGTRPFFVNTRAHPRRGRRAARPVDVSTSRDS